jgi:type IV pilus assembly protein PilW
MMPRVSPPNHQGGLTLMELLVAMTLGLFLLAGVIVAYLSSSQSYRVNETSSHLQEGARFALFKLGSNLRMAGHTGCFKVTSSSAVNNLATSAPSYSAATVLVGADAIAASKYTSAVAGTDDITVRKASASAVNLKTLMATGVPLVPSKTVAITLFSNPYNFAANDLLFVADCERADLFCASTASATSIAHGTACNSSDTFSKAYGPDAQVMAYEESVFYIRTNADEEPALYWDNRSGGASTTEELATGVEDMQICYGEDTNSNTEVDVYRPAGSVVNWANVVSVRVSLLMRTTKDAVAASPQAYAIDKNCDGDTLDAGEATTPTDLRLRRVFTSTIGLRNRLP